jgi:hypothetical protein
MVFFKAWKDFSLSECQIAYKAIKMYLGFCYICKIDQRLIHLRHVPMSKISGANISAFPHSFMACTKANLSVVSPFPNVTESLTLYMNGFILSEIKIILLNYVNISYYVNLFKVSLFMTLKKSQSYSLIFKYE